MKIVKLLLKINYVDTNVPYYIIFHYYPPHTVTVDTNSLHNKNRYIKIDETKSRMANNRYRSIRNKSIALPVPGAKPISPNSIVHSV